MWFLVQVVKGSKHFEADSQVANNVLISDTTEMVISGRALGTESYRFEARKGNETFVLRQFDGSRPAGSLSKEFAALAHKIGAVILSEGPAAGGVA